MTQAARKKKSITSIRSGTYDLVVTSSDALPLSYMSPLALIVHELGLGDKGN